MARKKQATRKTAARAGKKPGKKAASRKKKISGKKPATRQAAKTSRTSASRKSVDAVLKKFKSERTSLESQLKNVRKKIDELEVRADKLQQQISKSRDGELQIAHKIDQLDARRDEEVSAVLAELGIQLGTSSSPPAFGSTSRSEPESARQPPAHKDAEDKQQKI